MQVAVVILNWNGKKFLKQFLPSVVQNSPEANIYVGDNASSDDSITFLKENYPQITIIPNDTNLGFADGYNKVLGQILEPYYVLLNSDVEVSENWLTPIISLFEKDNSLAACQPKIKAFHSKSEFEYAGAAGGYIDKYGFPFCKGRLFDTLETDNGQYDDACEIFWATGACLFVKREAYWEVGGLDADFFAHMEEIDLCWRLKRSGYKIMVEPKSTVYHVGGGTLSKSNPRKTYLNFRNGLSLMLKNLPEKGLYSKLFIRMLFDGVAAFKYLLSGQPRDFFAVLKAHGSFYSTYRNTFRKRGGHYPKLNGIYNRSIVIDYFGKGLKTFSSLQKDMW